MKLLEYQAIEIFSKYGLNTQKSIVLKDKEYAAIMVNEAGLRYPVAIKAQVPVGGRGKAGGILISEKGKQTRSIVNKLLFSELKGHTVNKLMVVEKCAIDKEWYISIILDRSICSPKIVFSKFGGVDVEETASNYPGAIISAPVDPLIGITDHITRYICSKSGVGTKYFDKLNILVTALYKMFIEYSCLLAEINPLVLNTDGDLIALDGKVVIDDSALYRLPDIAAFREDVTEHPLTIEARNYDLLYIPVSKGKVAIVSNGSGMIMSIMDLLDKKGIKTGCVVDLGGGATKDKVSKAVSIALGSPDIDTLFVCIFGGITRCDEVARGVCHALENMDNTINKNLIIRVEGTNKETGLKIISAIPNVITVDSIIEGVDVLAKKIPVEGKAVE